jgi:hypothetical protein
MKRRDSETEILMGDKLFLLNGMTYPQPDNPKDVQFYSTEN